MLGALANSAGVLFGGLLGALLGSRIKEKYTSSLLSALALASVGLGVVYCIGTDDPLCLIVCLAAGTFIGELLRIDDGVKGLGALAGRLAERSGGSGGRFTQAFVSCSIIFCVGSMSVMGSVQSGLNGDNSILFAKAVLDFVASLAYGAALGAGVPAAAACVLVVEGGIALLAGSAAPLLTDAAVAEMSAVGGVLLVGLGLELLGARAQPLKIANMLPGVFLPVAYLPLSEWLSGLL